MAAEAKISRGNLEVMPAREKMPAGCHDCSLGELRSAFQCIATEREIHRNGSSRKAVNNIVPPKTSQHMKFFQASGDEHRQIPSLVVVAEGQMETGLQFAKEKKQGH